ncbi:MAG: DNA-processing protein DprA [Phycisphaerales bacterium]
MATMSEDANAILLLCGRFGPRSLVAPLEQGEYNRLARWLASQGRRPSDLLQPDRLDSAARGADLNLDRLTALIGRGMQLAFAVEQWNRSGIWVLCRSDHDYPIRFKGHLREKAPPVLFGAGDRSLLQGGGLAIVGSRNVDDEGARIAGEVAAWCASHRVRVVSGGARGVDKIAMSSALATGGEVIGILAEDLLRSSVARDAREAISDGRLLLVSPNHPEAGFSVGTAMARNKLIYAMADFALVISAEHKKGGTWSGAVEELQRAGGRPVFVRVGGAVQSGNSKLVDVGAIPWPKVSQTDEPPDVLNRAAAGRALKPVPQSDLLFDEPKARSTDASASVPGAESSASAAESGAGASSSVYEAVLPILLDALKQPTAVEQLAERLDVSKAQLTAWLKRAAVDGHVSRLTKPARYLRRTP